MGRKPSTARWLGLKRELGLSSLEPPSLRAEPYSGGVKGLGVRSLPELGMVVSQQRWHMPGTPVAFSPTFSLVPSDQASPALRRGARRQVLWGP